MDLPRPDSTAPLPPPPEPWVGLSMPSPRSGPPFHMTEMIEAEPAFAARLLRRLANRPSGAATLAAAIRDTATAGHPIVVTGCGTSEHAAMGAAEILGEALRAAGLAPGPRAVVSEQAFELAFDPPVAGLVIGVSHEGGSAATNAALEAARAAGCRTAVVTASDASPAAALADVVVATGEMDQSWCHTVGYLSPLLAATATAAALSGRARDADRVAELVRAGTQSDAAAEAIAAQVSATDHLIVVASGSDRAAGRELVLKVEEASWLPSAYRDLETFLHGHIPATGDRTALVLILSDRERRTDRVARARQALAAARTIGVVAAAIVGEGVDPELEASLTPAGRIVIPDDSGLASPVAALLGTASALQLLTERLARHRGTNPDPIRRDDPRYLEASAAAET